MFVTVVSLMNFWEDRVNPSWRFCYMYWFNCQDKSSRWTYYPIFIQYSNFQINPPWVNKVDILTVQTAPLFYYCNELQDNNTKSQQWRKGTAPLNVSQFPIWLSTKYVKGLQTTFSHCDMKLLDYTLGYEMVIFLELISCMYCLTLTSLISIALNRFVLK